MEFIAKKMNCWKKNPPQTNVFCRKFVQIYPKSEIFAQKVLIASNQTFSVPKMKKKFWCRFILFEVDSI